jgi:hypothetical protein
MSLLLGPACLRDDCSGPVVLIDGEPSEFAITPGTQPEGYVVDAPVICSDGIGSITVRWTGAQELTSYYQVDEFYQQVRTTLGAEGFSTHGWGATGEGTMPECADSVLLAPYTYYLQFHDWAAADAAVKAIGTQLVHDDVGTAVGVRIGHWASCPV